MENINKISDMGLLKRLLLDKIKKSENISRTEFDSRFDDMYIKAVRDGVAYVALPSNYMIGYYKEHGVDSLLKKYLSDLLGTDLEIYLFVDPSISPEPDRQLLNYVMSRSDRSDRIDRIVDEDEDDDDIETDEPITDLDEFLNAEVTELEFGLAFPRNGDKKNGYVSYSADEIVEMAKRQKEGPSPRNISSPQDLKMKEEYTFENFIVGDSNKVAAAFAETVADNPGDKKHNPLYIYGPPGVGKTHLVYAIANRIHKNDPKAKIEYIRGEDFVNLFIEMIRQRNGGAFREKFRNADLLIIDDIQFINDKDKTQDELFHTFNTLYENNKQIVFTADKLPREIPQLAQRLESRMESGVMADIQLPSYELRLAILREKAQSSGLDLSDDVEDFLAKNIENSIRQIEGAVKKLSGMNDMLGGNINLDNISILVPEYLGSNLPTQDVVKNVIEACAEYYRVTTDDIIGEKREKTIQTARNAAIYILRKKTDLSTSGIGEILGGRKHTTIISNYKTVEKMIEEKPSYAAEIDQIIRNSQVK